MELDTIICGDNCEVMRKWDDECIDLVVTSPPYDNLRTYGGHEWDFEGIAGQLTRCLKPGGVIVWVVGDATVDGSETLTSMRQAIHFKDVCGLNVHDTMIYQTNKPPINGPRYEPELGIHAGAVSRNSKDMESSARKLSRSRREEPRRDAWCKRRIEGANLPEHDGRNQGARQRVVSAALAAQRWRSGTPRTSCDLP